VKMRILCLTVCMVVLCGCTAVELMKPVGPPSAAEIRAPYDIVQLNVSTSADVLSSIGKAKHELVSQSRSVIAAAGEKNKGRAIWFTLVGFDENELIARRKYVLIVDERPKKLFARPWEGLWLDSQVVLDNKVLDEPYANENARRIAILRSILETTRKDIKEVAPDSQTIEKGGMMINQAFETALVKLDASPSMAQRLSDATGMEFQHPNLDRGRLRLAVQGNVATVQVWLGSATSDTRAASAEK